MRKVRLRIIALLLVAGLPTVVSPAVPSVRDGGTRVKNVILLIPDGMSLSGLVLTRWYKGGRSLAMDKYAVGFVRTYCADTLITDSAAAASAFATGRKVEYESLSVAPVVATMPEAFAASRGDAHRPLPTILEAARLKGLSTGLVSTSPVVDPTPAAFGSHVMNRYSDRAAITEQLVHAGIDVFLAGGTDFLVPGTAKHNRKDGKDLTRALAGQGYAYVTDRAGLAAAARPGVWGLFAPVGLEYQFDRSADSRVPGLAELTRHALRLLSGDKDGFFLMVESGEIDSFGHDGDPIGVISEILAFDEAFRAAMDFAVADGRTAVVACPDHATGGLSIEGYGDLDGLLAVLKKPRATSYAVQDRIAPDGANLEQVLAHDYGLDNLSPSEGEAVRAGFRSGNLPVAIGRVLSARAGLEFSTDGHTGEDVPLFAFHPSGYLPTGMAESGVVQNTDISRYIQKVLGLDLAAAGRALHQPAALFEARGAQVALESGGDGLVVRVTRGRDVLDLPVNRNQAVLNGRLIQLNGLVTVIGDHIWVPRQAIELFR